MLISIAQASRELGLSTQHIRKLIRLNRWPHYRLGPRSIRLDLEEIRGLGRLVAEAGTQMKGKDQRKKRDGHFQK